METKSKHIDLTYLKQLANGSNEFICQMISVFMVQTPEALINMEKYMNGKDWKALHGIAHKMKPSFAFMGIKELESIVLLVEDSCQKETNLSQIPQWIAKIKETCTVALEELEIEKKLFM